jgi:hypothetical protein
MEFSDDDESRGTSEADLEYDSSDNFGYTINEGGSSEDDEEPSEKRRKPSSPPRGDSSAPSQSYSSNQSVATSSQSVWSSISSLTSGSVPSGVVMAQFKRGYKGSYVTTHRHPRVRKAKDSLFEFVKLFKGDEKVANSFIVKYEKLEKAKQKDEADGVISALIALGAGARILLDILGVGRPRYYRIFNERGKKEKRGGPNGKQVTPEIYADIESFINSLRLELGYPCSHRRIKSYVDEVKINTWVDFHAHYKAYEGGPNPGVRKVALSTLEKLMKKVFPDVSLQRAKEDCCDACMKYDLAAKAANSEDERLSIAAEKKTHWDEARTQRDGLKAAMRTWANNLVLEESIDDVEMDNLCARFDTEMDAFLDDGLERRIAVTDKTGGIRHQLVLCTTTDFGGNLTAPYYGSKRPSKDYYTSNLNVYAFVVSGISTGLSHSIVLYDETAMGKDADALCSLRLWFHLLQVPRGRMRPTMWYDVRDNCVGQNKSQAVLMFDCFLSITLYEKVAVQYLVSGHSHMPSDRDWAHAKGCLKNKDLFLPQDMAELISQVCIVCYRTVPLMTT